MFLEILLFSILGICVGTITGLIPGFHINTLIPFIMGMTFLFASPYYLTAFIVSLTVTWIFISYIPSVFLGAPQEDTSLAVLPGHRLLLEGRGYEAIKLTIIGGMGSLMITLILVSIFSTDFSNFYDMLRPYIQYLIAIVVLFMIASEKRLRKILSAVLIILLSGFFGIITLSSSLVPSENVFFPMLTGMFGLSTIIISMKGKSKIPTQKEDSNLNISKVDLLKSILLGSVAGTLIGGETRSFLVSLSGIRVAHEVVSLLSLYIIQTPRSGASIAIQKILPELAFYDVVLMIGVICFASGIAVLITMFLGKRIPKLLAKLNYKYLCLSVIIFMLIMIFLMTGVYGLLIVFTSTSIGLLCAHLGIKKSHCMGCLLIPSILIFSGLNGVVLSILGI
ncbi:MAG: tripartite tricarboxylate transporter permease [Candidatus Aenigmarchaeota archaeon]|nr:tripartite tricarboxylate transporter permease [Candidatus Aenigmarchaeota archaeon]